jgi:superfamily II DNA helicase RecQ
MGKMPMPLGRVPIISNTAPPIDFLQSTFGFSEFREGQEPVISRLLASKSVLAIFPTGAGKSLCYQLPALMLDGITLVISPLIALMKDQIDFLVSHGVPAARLDSTVSFEDSGSGAPLPRFAADVRRHALRHAQAPLRRARAAGR